MRLDRHAPGISDPKGPSAPIAISLLAEGRSPGGELAPPCGGTQTRPCGRSTVTVTGDVAIGEIRNAFLAKGTVRLAADPTDLAIRPAVLRRLCDLLFLGPFGLTR